MQEFLEHCCKSRHYFFPSKNAVNQTAPFVVLFVVRQKISNSCIIFRIQYLVKDLYYKSFEELYGTQTMEDHRPSLKDAKMKKNKMATTKKHSMPFCPSAIRAKNVGVIVNCIECEKPRLLFSARNSLKRIRQCYKRF